MEHLLAFLLSLVTVGLKGFQHKNVQGDHYRLVFGTSILMAVGDVATIGLIVRSGWSMALPLGLGAGLGMVGSMWLHRRIIRR